MSRSITFCQWEALEPPTVAGAEEQIALFRSGSYMESTESAELSVLMYYCVHCYRVHCCYNPLRSLCLLCYKVTCSSSRLSQLYLLKCCGNLALVLLLPCFPVFLCLSACWSVCVCVCFSVRARAHTIYPSFALLDSRTALTAHLACIQHLHLRLQSHMRKVMQMIKCQGNM